MSIKTCSIIIQGMNKNSLDSYFFGSLGNTQYCIPQQCGTDTLLLHVIAYCQTCDQPHRDWVRGVAL